MKPTMTFHAEDVGLADRATDGPILVYWGQDLGLSYGGDPLPQHRATWIGGQCKARTAAAALSSATRALQLLGQLEVGAVQILVEQWPAESEA